MNSINRNPFESDDDNDFVGDNHLSFSKKPQRKKRRAPLPPVSSILFHNFHKFLQGEQEF